MKLKHITFGLLSAAVISACQTSTPTPTSTKAIEAVSASELMNADQQVLQLVDSYSAESLEFNPIRATFIGIDGYNDKFGPIISEVNNAKQLAFEKAYLKKAQAISPQALTGQAAITHQIFVRDREMAIQGNRFPAQQAPINQMFGVHNFFAQLGSGQSVQPFNTEQDYRNFMSRAQGFADWMDSAIIAMREGMSSGVVQPEPIVKKVLPQLKAHISEDIEQTVFYAPVKNMPDSIQGEAREQLVEDYSATIKNVIIPTYQRMFTFMQTEYLPGARSSVGLSALPDGEAWYEYQIKTHTTLELTADEIHEFGQQEVARILNEMELVRQRVGFEGNLAEFFVHLREDDQFYFESEEALIKAYTNVKSKIDSKLPALFDVFPKADYEVRPVPAFRARSAAGASYQRPAPDGSRPGIFYINSYNLKSQPKFLVETLSIHEAAPGHHFQIALQQEVEGLPDYRKFGGFTVFSEGWALYAESLGKEMGMFTDPYMWYGRLVDEQLRAMRLVVDTGLHAKGWSREQAINFMLENSSMARSDVEAEVERYIVMPGQALAYKVGERKIRQLRNQAEAALGANFDIKKFHTQILIDGSMPMPVLEQKINRWMEAQKGS